MFCFQCFGRGIYREFTEFIYSESSLFPAPFLAMPGGCFHGTESGVSLCTSLLATAGTSLSDQFPAIILLVPADHVMGSSPSFQQLVSGNTAIDTFTAT